MELTKHEHATVTIRKGSRALLIDPGTFPSDVGALVARADAVLVTHEHFDHFDVDAIRGGLEERRSLSVYGPPAIVEVLEGFRGRVHAVAAGDSIEIDDFHIRVYGDTHAVIHPEIPTVDNVGYLIDDAVLHPGDAYLVPGVSVKPRQSIQIHEAMHSALGQYSAARFLGKDGLTGTPLRAVPVGESLEV